LGDAVNRQTTKLLALAAIVAFAAAGALTGWFVAGDRLAQRFFGMSVGATGGLLVLALLILLAKAINSVFQIMSWPPPTRESTK